MKVRLRKTEGLKLSEQLLRKGMTPDLKCGGKGICGRCKVRLLSGEWEANGRRLKAPCVALACRTKLVSDFGEVEFEPVSGRVFAPLFREFRILPNCIDTVVGIDIGTTALAAAKLEQGAITASADLLNPQIAYGDNVISRISAAEAALDKMRECIVDACEELLDRLGRENVTRIAVSGNTVTSCIFHGIDPKPIGISPFTPPVRKFAEQRDLFGGIPVTTVPCVSGYVGGDIVSGLGEVDLKPGEMLVDIGTNCEMVFCTDSGVVCSSAAAGPAFEGAGLEFGCRAAPGVIDHYRGTNDFTCIGNTAPTGLCGSAYIDFLAAERAAGRLTEFGRFSPAADSAEISAGIFISERDIEQLLKAKAAVYAGIVSLEEYCGAKAEKIYLAGSFAAFLDLRNAIAAGMLPDRKYEAVGNTSLAGALRLAANPTEMTRLEKLSDKPVEVPLNTIPGFDSNFLNALLLP